MKLTFLNAPVPLTKTYTRLSDGTIEKSSYPNVWEVTSIIEDCPDIKTLEQLINKHAALGNCLLKGQVLRPLVSESRKDSTDRNASTDWLCLDLDGIDVTGGVTVDTVLTAMGLNNISYVLQWSGSQGIFGTSLRCHVFMLLSKPVSAPLIKQWLIQKNHAVDILRNHQALTKTGNSLTWGLDITACQSDKLIYIAPPVLKGIRNPLGRTPRVSLITKPLASYELVERISSTEQNRALTDARVHELRDVAGLPKRKAVYKIIGPHEVMVKPGECIATEIKQDRGFVYFNINGGDSWAYYHPENNPEYIHNFKGEPIYLTRDLLPNYWEQLKSAAHRTSSAGITYLAYLDKKTSTYWRGTYDQGNDVLDVYSAKTETMVRHFAGANGMPLGDNIPEWGMEFNPHQNIRVDFKNKVVNTFQPSAYMRAPDRRVSKCPPTALKIISHVLAGDLEAIEHFMNWLAYIVQARERTMTAWIFQGTQGTGKGLLMNKILAPLFGAEQTVMKRAGELSEKWTDYVAGKFIVFIDEVQTSAYRDETGVIANVKNLITEPWVQIRVMNKNAYLVRNYASWIFASNKPDPVSVDKEDRRFNVGPYQPNKLVISDEELLALEGELQAFYHYLNCFAVDKNAVSTPMNNMARDTLIELSQTTSESTASAVKEGNFQFFLDQLPTGDAYKANTLAVGKVEEYRKALVDVMGRTREDGTCNVRRDELYIMFNYVVGGMSASPAMFTRFLGHRQIGVKPVSIGGKVERGVPVIWSGATKFNEHMKNYFPDYKVKA